VGSPAQSSVNSPTLDVVITGAEYGPWGARTASQRTIPSLYEVPARRMTDSSSSCRAKAYSGVTDAEILELTEWLKLTLLKTRPLPHRGSHRSSSNGLSTHHAQRPARLRLCSTLSTDPAQFRTDKPLAEIDTLERVESYTNPSLINLSKLRCHQIRLDK